MTDSEQGMRGGRNEPCHCGSGLKYKRCCLHEDAETAAAGVRAQEDAAATAALGGGPVLSPYGIARAIEEAMGGRGIELTEQLKRGLRDKWTISKVASMSTERIEQKLRGLGVKHTRERFLHMAEGHQSAWSIGQTWLETAGVPRRVNDEDFIGLAACELWKRLLPDRPSVEMIDDWMQEGYEHDEGRRLVEATRIWWKVWETLRSRFSPSIRTMTAAEAVFRGTQVVFNWCQDFENCLHNVVIENPEFAGLGKQYCTEWLAQFSDEGGHTQVNFLRALARFQFHLGETSAGEATLHGIIDRWPEDAWGYVALADAYSHFWRGDPGPERDFARALGYVEQGLVIATDPEDRTALLERLEELRRRSAI